MHFSDGSFCSSAPEITWEHLLVLCDSLNTWAKRDSKKKKSKWVLISDFLQLCMLLGQIRNFTMWVCLRLLARHPWEGNMVKSFCLGHVTIFHPTNYGALQRHSRLHTLPRMCFVVTRGNTWGTFEFDCDGRSPHSASIVGSTCT